MKDPTRWNEVLIDSPFATLTKRDVHDYYADPKIQRKILEATQGKETIIRQTFSPGELVLRRKDPRGDLIRVSSPEKLEEWNQVRATEFHPVFGRRTDTLLADIDPGSKVDWKTTKSIAETIAKTLDGLDDVKKTEVFFSGDRGFYVRSQLEKAMDIDKARAKVQETLHGIAQRPDVTFGVAKPDQIRIDTSVFKYRGSTKAPYSLSGRTGLVSAPVKIEDLPKVEKEDFKIEKIVKKAAHILITGRPGSGKTTVMEEMRDRLGLPTVHIDSVPERKAAWKNLIDAQRNLGEVENKVIQEALSRKDPHIIEGWQLLGLDPKDLEPHRRILVDPGKKRSLDQFVARELERNPNADLSDIRSRALSLAAESEEGVKKFRAIPGTEVKRPKALAKKASLLKSSAEVNFDIIRFLDMFDEHIPQFLRYREKLRQRELAAQQAQNQPYPMGQDKVGSEEFAPGIPKSRAINPIPEVKNKAWTLAIQKHEALKAGPHFDFRLVDPKTNQAHSFAVPKMKLPKPGEPMVLAIQQPTHTADYALHFEGDIPKGTYGAGKVTMPIKEPIQVIKSNADRIHLQRENGDELVMFRTKGNNWGLKAKEK